MPSPPAPRKRMSAVQRREQLLNIGREAFAEKGFDAMTVEELASRAGVTKPIVYEHFGGKEGLYAVVVDRELRDLMGRVEAALASGGSRARIEASALAFLSYIEDTPDGFRVLLRDTPAVGGSETSFGGLIGDIADKVDQLLATELDSRGFDRQLAPLYSRAVIGLIANVGHWWLETGTPSRDETAAHIANIAFNGLERLEKEPVLLTR